MNERIQKLMKQSMVEYQFDIRFSPEKFAELIVRECIDKLKETKKVELPFLQEDYGLNHPYPGGWERGVIDSCQIIKKHFGVEE